MKVLSVSVDEQPTTEETSISLTLGISCMEFETNDHVDPRVGQPMSIRGSCKRFCHWVRITSVLGFIKHVFITNLQSIPPLLKYIFVTFLPSREKQINSLLLVSVGDTAKRTSRGILISRKHFLKPWK